MLVVDVGNTRTKLARLTPAPGGDFRVDDREELPGADAPAVLAAVRARLDAPDAPVAVASVVPAVGEPLLEALPGARPADHRATPSFGLAVSDPAAVGADRYCNVAAAAARGRRDALVVDAGTATTFDVLRDGVFVGGLIAPGIAFAGRALGERAARLAPVEIEPADAAPRPDTAGALAAGSWLTGLHGVLGTLEALRAAEDPGLVVMTGGLAPLIRESGVLPAAAGSWIWDPDWTLKGAAALAFPDVGA